ncbi:MAG TPA: peptidase dimerization domain-containing protein [Gemmatimonadaceae bacterium]|nr:peptidase dimerization domain-containing protein [Gemmatimonadaceae bacterium]
MRFRRPLALLVLAAVASHAAQAQDTPTERTAAREVLEKMATLQRTVNVTGWTARLAASDAVRDRIAARARALMDGELLALADDITKHPEIGFKETRSVKLLTDWLTAHDFDVTMGSGGFATAFTAKHRRTTTGPVLGIVVEYDALRGTNGDFHGDQHSAQGPVGLAAAQAIAEWLVASKTPGQVVVIGTPAEEMMPPPAKTVMHEQHVFDSLDIVVRSHSSMASSRAAAGFGSCCLNIDGVRFTFSGAPAHQMTPWDGRNALTAVRHLFDNIDALRGTFRPETRIQGIITEGGKAPNVVPDRAVADFYVRYPDEVYLAQVRQMVDDAARAAALATGTKVKIETYGSMRDGISLGLLNEAAFAHVKRYGGGKVQAEPGKPQGWEETGSVSSAVPGVGFSAWTSNGGYHTYEMEADALGPVGHGGFVVDAQAMAALLYDFATKADFRAAVKQEFAGLKALYSEYQGALQKAYTIPVVRDPK